MVGIVNFENIFFVVVVEKSFLLKIEMSRQMMEYEFDDIFEPVKIYYNNPEHKPEPNQELCPCNLKTYFDYEGVESIIIVNPNDKLCMAGKDFTNQGEVITFYDYIDSNNTVPDGVEKWDCPCLGSVGIGNVEYGTCLPKSGATMKIIPSLCDGKDLIIRFNFVPNAIYKSKNITGLPTSFTDILKEFSGPDWSTKRIVGFRLIEDEKLNLLKFTSGDHKNETFEHVYKHYPEYRNYAELKIKDGSCRSELRAYHHYSYMMDYLK